MLEFLIGPEFGQVALDGEAGGRHALELLRTEFDLGWPSAAAAMSPRSRVT
jgi:hypothetical protein